jgi:hypothetical protein
LIFNTHNEGLSLVLQKSEEARKIAKAATKKIDETNKKLGHVHEETWRRRLTEEERLPWARNFAFDMLAELVDWVGGKIQCDREGRLVALRTIVSTCVEKFTGFDEIYNTPWSQVIRPFCETILIF